MKIERQPSDHLNIREYGERAGGNLKRIRKNSLHGSGVRSVIQFFIFQKPFASDERDQKRIEN